MERTAQCKAEGYLIKFKDTKNRERTGRTQTQSKITERQVNYGEKGRKKNIRLIKAKNEGTIH